MKDILNMFTLENQMVILWIIVLFENNRYAAFIAIMEKYINKNEKRLEGQLRYFSVLYGKSYCFK